MVQQKAWCILEPNGKTLRIDTIRHFKKDSISVIMDDSPFLFTWKDYKKYGWKCIKITISR